MNLLLSLETDFWRIDDHVRLSLSAENKKKRYYESYAIKLPPPFYSREGGYSNLVWPHFSAEYIEYINE